MKKTICSVTFVLAILLLLTFCHPAVSNGTPTSTTDTITPVSNHSTASATTSGTGVTTQLSTGVTTRLSTTVTTKTVNRTTVPTITTSTTTTTGGATMLDKPTTTTGTTPDESVGAPLKILAIGNSFSMDAMEHLGEILVGEGYKNFVLGDLYIGGCSLDTHYKNIQSGANAYSFYLNTGRGWSSSTRSIQHGITYTDWDIITIQQVSGFSGIPASYDKLQAIIDHVRETAGNPDIKIYWHMTWAYQGGSTHSDFAKYNNDQIAMYNAIVDTIKEKILTNDTIDAIIPSGTAIQNLRTSYLGDTLTRDGYHLSNDIGRYTAALVWYKQLIGADITDLTVVPKKFPIVKRHLRVIKQAVNDAVQTPLTITSAENQ